jgi:hypothetical protein
MGRSGRRAAPIRKPRTIHVPEPMLRFGHGQRCEYVKDGLFSFGPLAPIPSRGALRFGVVGTTEGMRRFDRWSESIRTGIPCADDKAHKMSWPGFSAVFEIEWPKEPLARVMVDHDSVRNAIRRENRHEAVYEAVGIFETAIRRYLEKEESLPDFWFVVIDEEVFRLGRPEQIVPVAVRTESMLPMSSRSARKSQAGGTALLFPEWQKDAEATLAVEAYEVNFHNQLKARMLQHRAVIQILRETTITPDEFVDARGKPKRKVDDPATVAWNLCTTAFFKAQGKPWQLDAVRPGVCYVGLVYKQLHAPTANANACCGAQMFLDSGDGVVFKGVDGNWYKADTKECHISEDKAAELMSTVVASYRDKHGGPPTELFIHGKARFDEAEWKGFRSAVPSGTQLAGVRIRRSLDDRLYRGQGATPVLRGIAAITSKYRALLWSRGYVPRLRTYPGWEVPAPIDVEISQGEADIDQVLTDVLGLTKLNYNACIYADGMPVTLRFANAVGEILTAIPSNDYRPLPFRYYI